MNGEGDCALAVENCLNYAFYLMLPSPLFARHRNDAILHSSQLMRDTTDGGPNDFRPSP